MSETPNTVPPGTTPPGTTPPGTTPPGTTPQGASNIDNPPASSAAAPTGTAPGTSTSSVGTRPRVARITSPAPAQKVAQGAAGGNKSLAAEFEAQKRREKAGGFLIVARTALKAGDREKARAAIKDAFAANPGDAAAIDLLGEMYLEEGETEKALTLYEKALQAHPGNARFEEQLAICRLDLAEIEADKNTPHFLLMEGGTGKVFERSMGKAVTLSLIVPGAGQCYNDQIEKGVAFAVGYLLANIAWFYPLWNQLSSSPADKARLDFGAAAANLSGLGSICYRIGTIVSLVIFIAALVDTIMVTKAYNEERNKRLGLS